MKSSPWVRKIIALITFGLAWLLQISLRTKIIVHPRVNFKHTNLAAFWHGKQFLPAFTLRKLNSKNAALVSPSKDGDILSFWLRALGYSILRGSSRKNNVAALANMMTVLNQGYSLGFGIDGPIGPIYKVKPGMTYMAQKLNIPILPIGSFYTRKWIFEKAWDKFEIPKPFSKVYLYVGEPFVVDESLELESCNIILEEKINLSEKMASLACQNSKKKQAPF